MFNLTFGEVLRKLKHGDRVARSGWNGKNMWIALITEHWSGMMKKPVDLPENWSGYSPFIVMFTADGKLVPWLASQTDILAEDWGVVSIEKEVKHDSPADYL